MSEILKIKRYAHRNTKRAKGLKLHVALDRVAQGQGYVNYKHALDCVRKGAAA